jgi:hypothetical protein
MLLRHATPCRNLNSIKRFGLLTGKARGRMKAVWFHSESKTPWAVLHVAQRHATPAEHVCVIEVSLPRRLLRRARNGLWFIRQDVAPSHFRNVLYFRDLAGTDGAA